jgi:hypothetical protein
LLVAAVQVVEESLENGLALAAAAEELSRINLSLLHQVPLSQSQLEWADKHLSTTERLQAPILIFAVVLPLYLEASPPVVERRRLTQPPQLKLPAVQLAVSVEMEMLVELPHLPYMRGDMEVQAQVHQAMQKIQAQVLHQIFQEHHLNTVEVEIVLIVVQQV